MNLHNLAKDTKLSGLPMHALVTEAAKQQRHLCFGYLRSTTGLSKERHVLQTLRQWMLTQADTRRWLPVHLFVEAETHAQEAVTWPRCAFSAPFEWLLFWMEE